MSDLRWQMIDVKNAVVKYTTAFFSLLTFHLSLIIKQTEYHPQMAFF